MSISDYLDELVAQKNALANNLTAMGVPSSTTEKLNTLVPKILTLRTPPHIYGTSWNKSSSTLLTRTDDSADFADPVPYVSNGNGSSPFDTLYPWNGMTRETIDGNVLVKIPKFWYKITNNGNELKFQIADSAADGFSVSPAHANRGDGVGERDYVYVGRYKCNATNYKSTSGVLPKINITRASARTAVTALGTGYFLQDYAMFWTIRMLYLVEFANWNSQSVIGYGCGNNSGAENMGATDAAQYHTGTSKSSRTTYGTGVQYRHIEDPWGNVLEWIDGVRFSGSNVYVASNPSTYDDKYSGTNVLTRSMLGSNISAWTAPFGTGLDWALCPSATAGSNSTYVSDGVAYRSANVVLCTGGCYVQDQYSGLFHTSDESNTASSVIIGARLQYLPPASS